MNELVSKSPSLVRGRLYLSENYICFASNVFGVNNSLKIQLREVAAIEKSKVLGLWDNCLLVKLSIEGGERFARY